MNAPRRSLLVLAILLVSPVLAHAQNGNPYLDAGMRLYGDFEYEAALDQLTKASTFPGNSPAAEIQIALYRGLIKLELGDQPGAETDFKTALAFDPSAKLPTGVSPKISEVFERIRAEIVASRPPAPVVTAPQATVAQTPAQAQPQPQLQPQAAPQPQPATTFVFVPPPPVSQQQQAAQPVDLSVRNAPAPEVAPEVVSGSAPPQVAAEPRSKATRIIAAVLIGAGAALGGGGAYFGVQSSNSVQDARAAEFRSDGEDSLDRARGQALTANVMYGAATAAVVSGVITLFAGE